MKISHSMIIDGSDDKIAQEVWPLNEQILKRCQLEDNAETGLILARALRASLDHYRKNHAQREPDFGFSEYYTFFVSQEIERQNSARQC